MARSLEQISLYRISVFSDIHEIVFHGKGGYTYDVVYNMPIWLRKFTINKLKEWYDEESSPKNDNEIDMENPDRSKVPSSPQYSPPSYISKMSKKP